MSERFMLRAGCIVLGALVAALATVGASLGHVEAAHLVRVYAGALAVAVLVADVGQPPGPPGAPAAAPAAAAVVAAFAMLRAGGVLVASEGVGWLAEGGAGGGF